MKSFIIFFLAASVGYLHQEMAAQPSPQRMAEDEQVIHISASAFEFKPDQLTVKKGVPVVLELISQDRHHGFKLPQFNVRVDLKPGAIQNVRFVPNKTGSFTFSCDVFCGDGHEEMSGIIEVID
jgi:cytochrome c oxidase subunit 2